MTLIVNMIKMIDRALRFFLKAVVRAYQFLLSPLMPICCRFTPSCSEYAILALESFATPKALFFIATRFMRCNPLFKSGYDPLPRSADHQH